MSDKGIEFPACLTYTTGMSETARIAVEAGVVGIIFAVFMLIASRFVRLDTSWAVALAGFVAGVLGHLAFEVVGGNAWYCKNGVACTKAKA
jgi:hypothetical protein